MEDAIDYLRKKGLASADKRSGRATSQGLVIPVISEDKHEAGIIEVNCETDFVAKTDDFINFANKLAELVLTHKEIKTLADLEKLTVDGVSIDEFRKSVIAKTGENITLGRAEHLSIPEGTNGFFDKYIHNNGAIGILVQAATTTPEATTNAKVLETIHNLSLQVAASKPLYTYREEIPVEVLNRETDVIKGQLANDPENAKKPEMVINKIIEGRLNKFCKENCLVFQEFFDDEKKTVTEILEELRKEVNAEVKVVTFRRWERGEAPQTSATEKTTEAGA
jgi:elongation factor Ts